MRDFQIVIYGSYGYTGQLIVNECKHKNLNVLLSGRNASKLKEQSASTGYPFEVADTANQQQLKQLLMKAFLVIHCAGPFRHTARAMVEACLETGTHYTDITGEYDVFETLAAYDHQAKERSIMIMPGVGFDVVPSDCLALHLKNRLPDATHLTLAFAMSRGGLSRGTAKTMVEGMGYGSMIRLNGRLTNIPFGKKIVEVNFGKFSTRALCIPWGDIATAWRSTHIPNIEVYTGVPNKVIGMAKFSKWFNWLLRQRWVKRYFIKRIDQQPAGPDEEKRITGRSYLWGKVQNNQGHTAEARLETLSGYLLTAKTSVTIAEKLLSNTSSVNSGYFTPAQYFGETLINEIDGTRWYK